MNYFSEKDIRDIVAGVISGSGAGAFDPSRGGQTVPVEISARHVHLTEDALSVLFGAGYQLSQKRDLSQPGQFLAQERVKLVTRKGEIDNVAVLGPARKQVQVELSLTDARSLGISAPVRLSGDLSGAADVLILGPAGIYEAKGSVIVAKAHVHMTPEDAGNYGVSDGQTVRIRLDTARPATLDNVEVRVSRASRLAVHIDFDEANAAAVDANTQGILIKGR
ncbi:MAG: phosphate propanoyltransferase [Clostridia bacterium]|nr:phosphate propanoyltransferase [Clostridia bacterium]